MCYLFGKNSDWIAGALILVSKYEDNDRLLVKNNEGIPDNAGTQKDIENQLQALARRYPVATLQVMATRQMEIPASIFNAEYKKWPEWSKQIKASQRSQVEPKLWNACEWCRISTRLYTLNKFN